jgi:hypothetical protein
MDALELVSRLIAGDVAIDGVSIRLRPTSTGRFETVLFESHPDFDRQQKRVPVLQVIGSETQMPVNRRDLDWELRSAVRPFDHVIELANDYSVTSTGDARSALEVVAFGSVEVDMSSGVVGNQATLGVISAIGFPREKISLGYRVMLQSQDRTHVVARSTIPPSAFSWTDQDGLQKGKAVIEVPNGAVVHCIAIFDGYAQHHYYIGDPENHPNQKRSVFELFDKDFKSLREVLVTPAGRGKGDAKAFEIAVSSVLWMLGFGVSNIGYSKKTSDAPDIIATTPFGNFFIVECTTGLLRAESKLQNLIARTVSIRLALEKSGTGRRALPIIITQRSRAEVMGDVGDAERNGVLVLSKDDFDRLLDRTLFVQNVEEAFVDAEAKVLEAMISHNGSAQA